MGACSSMYTGYQPMSYRSLAFSSLQELLDFLLPAAHAALQLPVLCHVSVHLAQKSSCILLQLGCLPLEHKEGVTASEVQCHPTAHRQVRNGMTSAWPAAVGPWRGLSCGKGSREGTVNERGCPGPIGTKHSPQRTQNWSWSGGTES